MSLQTNRRVSVVIPTYNRARFVGEAIDSVLNQTAPPAEVIVVDDGSTDDTEAVMERYRGRAQYVRKANGGVSSARNAGIAASTGDWIAFLDSDDLWRPTKLEVQLRELDAHPTAIAHFTNALIDRDFVAKDELFTLRGAAGIFRDAQSVMLERPLLVNLRYNIARNQTALIRRDKLLHAGSYDESYPVFEDTALMHLVALEGPWVLCNEPLADEIRRQETVVALGEQGRRSSHVSFELLMRCLNRLLDDPRLQPDERALARRKLAQYALIAASFRRVRGDRREARAAVATAWRSRPSAQAVVSYLRSFL
ncbi:MAG: glycosyltransferase family A protein [Alphaproteobacteria bacterium]